MSLAPRNPIPPSMVPPLPPSLPADPLLAGAARRLDAALEKAGVVEDCLRARGLRRRRLHDHPAYEAALMDLMAADVRLWEAMAGRRGWFRFDGLAVRIVYARDGDPVRTEIRWWRAGEGGNP